MALEIPESLRIGEIEFPITQVEVLEFDVLQRGSEVLLIDESQKVNYLRIMGISESGYPKVEQFTTTLPQSLNQLRGHSSLDESSWRSLMGMCEGKDPEYHEPLGAIDVKYIKIHKPVWFLVPKTYQSGYDQGQSFWCDVTKPLESIILIQNPSLN